METAISTDRTLDCGHTPSPNGPHTTGTAHTHDGREICWGCAERNEREAFAQADRYDAYLSADAKTLTTWTGATLARVTHCWKQRVGFGGERTYLRAVAPDGAKWHGTSPGAGMYARLRRSAPITRPWRMV